MAKLFEKQRTNFYYNWLSVIEDFWKGFWCVFYGAQCSYILNTSQKQSDYEKDLLSTFQHNISCTCTTGETRACVICFLFWCSLCLAYLIVAFHGTLALSTTTTKISHRRIKFFWFSGREQEIQRRNWHSQFHSVKAMETLYLINNKDIDFNFRLRPILHKQLVNSERPSS